jgi:hypothetical protein
MVAQLRPRLTYANVMATVAVFIALGGGSVAAVSITGKNVKDSSLTGKDIKNSSLTTRDVKNRSLLAADFKPGQLPAGARGAQGPPGSAGKDGFGELVYPDHAETVADGDSAEVAVACPAGTSATGGDVFANDSTDTDVTNQVVVSQGFKFMDPIGWFASITNNTGGEVLVTVDAACANADSVIASPSKNRRLRR